MYIGTYKQPKCLNIPWFREFRGMYSNVVLLQYCVCTKLLCYRNHIWMELVTIVYLQTKG